MIQRTVSPAATGPGADELLALLQGDIGDLARRGIDLIERAARERIDLHRVDEAVAHRLHARGGVGLIDAHGRIGGFGRRLADRAAASIGPGKRQAAWRASTIFTGAGGSAVSAPARRHRNRSLAE